jgi:hypothetical protein
LGFFGKLGKKGGLLVLKKSGLKNGVSREQILKYAFF